jgi:hypothetical protein
MSAAKIQKHFIFVWDFSIKYTYLYVENTKSYSVSVDKTKLYQYLKRNNQFIRHVDVAFIHLFIP